MNPAAARAAGTEVRAEGAPSVRDADVLIVGGGFAGFACFRAIDRKKRRVTLLTNKNHFLFTPLLASAATGALEIRSIIEPIRSFEKSRGEVVVAEVFDVNPREDKVEASFDGVRRQEVRYRTLVVAVGSATATYGIRGVREHCLFLKEVGDARNLREKVIAQFEKAVHLEGAERARALTFLVVGGGATGVETACDIDDLIEAGFKKEFPDLAGQARILVLEAGKDILTVFDQALVRYAERKLRQKKIIVRTQAMVREVQAHRLLLSDGSALEGETILWAAGIGPTEFVKRLARQLNVPLDRQGRIPVDRRLRVIGASSEIYAVGDCASLQDDSGHVLPPTGQVAQKEGAYLGWALAHPGRRDPRFNFKTMGMLASLGEGTAIADLGRFHFTGVLAWWFWKAVYITKLVSYRNKLSVLFDWVKVFLFGRNTASTKL